MFLWIIPAHAGNTFRCDSGSGAGEDHPRACGEHLACFDEVREDLGSSPRMRGTHGVLSYIRHAYGIIPAHAGNTRWNTGLELRAGDHPRACGEHNHLYELRYTVGGSSPRMRGTLRAHARLLIFVGIIPAHAGNTHILLGRRFSSRDHPRACGEHFGLL